MNLILWRHAEAEEGSNDLARVGRDPSGSRVLESLLEGSAPLKVCVCVFGVCVCVCVCVWCVCVCV